jgi:hypothetical protein
MRNGRGIYRPGEHRREINPVITVRARAGSAGDGPVTQLTLPVETQPAARWDMITIAVPRARAAQRPARSSRRDRRKTFIVFP